MKTVSFSPLTIFPFSLTMLLCLLASSNSRGLIPQLCFAIRQPLLSLSLAYLSILTRDVFVPADFFNHWLQS